MFTTSPKKIRLGMGILLTLSILGPSVQANERKFAYTYETGVLPAGGREFELWTTYRAGRTQFYSAFDQRLEYEIGLTNKLMTAFYLNWTTESMADNQIPTGVTTESQFEGVSSEWKYKLTDPVANRLGSALYGEVTLGTTEIELEGKLILDKRLGKNLLAYNFVVEGEWENKPGELEYEETKMENLLGYTRFFTNHFSSGLELKSTTKFTSENTPEYSALYLGPVVSYASEEWWVTFTPLWQLPAVRRSVNSPDEGLVLDEEEKFSARLLLSFHI